MERQTRIALAVGCVVLTALSIPVLSSPGLDDSESMALVAIPPDRPRETRVMATLAPDPSAVAPEAVRPSTGAETIMAPPRAAVPQQASAVRTQAPLVPLPPARPAARAPVQTSRAAADVPIAIPAPSELSWSSRLVTEARKYIGTNPTDMQRRWCARFMNLVLAKLGYNGTGSDAARSFASYGQRISQPKVGAIAVLSRGRNANLGHVGVISGIDRRGNPIVISGNHGRRVAESVYPRARVVAYVLPTTNGPHRPVLGRLAPPPVFSLARREASFARAEAPMSSSTAARGGNSQGRIVRRTQVQSASTQQFAARRAPAPQMTRGSERPAFLARLEADLDRAGRR